MRDAGGIRSIGRSEFERLAAIAPSLESGSVAMRFHVCEDARHVVYALIRGPLAGIGGRCWVDPAKPELTAFSWIS